MPRLLLSIVFLLTLAYGLMTPQSSLAAPSWWNRLWGSGDSASVDSDALQKTYQLTDEQGPWMIMALSFRGPDAMKDAVQTTQELRKKHKLDTYIHQQSYDFSESFVGRGVDRFGKPRQMRHHQNTAFEEVAILVGNYASVNDPVAQRDLEKLKSLSLDSLSKEEKKQSRSFDELRRIQNELLKKDKGRTDGVMKLAFITTNPLLPDEYFRPQGVDHFVAQLNEDIDHSLLENSGKYTVKVATFTGFSAVNPKHIRDVQERGMQSSRLEKGAIKAHRLTIALRAKGYDAYQFHDRKQSIVTVGNFATPGNRLDNGKFRYAPEVQDTIERFSAKQKAPTGELQHPGLQTGIAPETLLGIPFDIQPVLIPVPQRSVSSDFARRSYDTP